MAKIVSELDLKVSKAPVEEYGEGSVVYFEAKDPKTGKSHTLNLCKLKTLDYRFWRKLREKLKNFLNGRYNKEKLISKYESEIVELKNEGEYETCYPISYYLEVADIACDLVTSCSITINHLTTVYLDFLTLVRTCQKEKRNATNEEKLLFKNTRKYYQQAESGISLLSPDVRWPVWAALLLYQQILDSIERNDYDVFNRRAYVSTPKKLWCLPGSFLRAQVK